MATEFTKPDPSTLNTSGIPQIARDPSAAPQTMVSPTSVSRMQNPTYGMTNTGIDAITGGALGGILGMIIDRNKQAALGTNPTASQNAGTATGASTRPGTSNVRPITIPTGSGPYVPPGGYPNPGTPTTGTPGGTPIGGGTNSGVVGIAFPPGTSQEQVNAMYGTIDGTPNGDPLYVITGVNTTNGTVVAQPNYNLGGGNLTTSGGQGTPSTGSTQTGGLGGMTNNYSYSTITTGYGADPSGNIYQYNPDGSNTLVYTALGNGMYIYNGPSTADIPSGSVLNESGQQVFPNYGNYFDTTNTTPTIDVGGNVWDYTNNNLYYPTDPYAGWTPYDPNTYYQPIDTSGSMFGSGTSTDTSVYTPIDTSGGMFSSFFKKGGLATPMYKKGGTVKHFVDGGTTGIDLTPYTTTPTDTSNILGITDPVPVGVNLTSTDALVDPATGLPLTTMLNQTPVAYSSSSTPTGFIDQVLANQMPSSLDMSGTAGGIVNALTNAGSNTSSPGGVLNSLTSLLSNSGVQGTLIGALLGQLLSSSGTASVNKGVDMSSIGHIPGRTTNFGIGAPRYASYDQYGTPTAPTNAFDQLLSNLGVSQTTHTSMPTMFTAPDRSILTPAPVSPAATLPISSQYTAGANQNPAVYTPPTVIPKTPPTTSVVPVVPTTDNTTAPTGGLNQTTTGTITPPVDTTGGLAQTGTITPPVTTPTTPVNTTDNTHYEYGTNVDPNTVLNPSTTDTTGGLGQVTTPTDTSTTPTGGETPITPDLGQLGHEGDGSEANQTGETAANEAEQHPSVGNPPPQRQEGENRGLHLGWNKKLENLNNRLEKLQDKYDNTENENERNRIQNKIDHVQNQLDFFASRPTASTMPTNHLAQGGLPQPGGVPVVQGRHDFRAGSAVNGAGDGQSDDIPAMLADGEYVIDSEVVSMLGNGSNKAGAKKLDEFREAIRSHKRSTPLHKIPPPSKSPLAYLKGKK